jgi:pimeloyl-ACP methyl ester carboxylesterase
MRIHLAEAGQGAPVVFIHGFPEIWYSRRYQLPAVAAAGYHGNPPGRRTLDRGAPERGERTLIEFLRREVAMQRR